MTTVGGVPLSSPVPPPEHPLAPGLPSKKVDSLTKPIMSAAVSATEGALDLASKVTEHVPPILGLGAIQIIHSIKRIAAKIKKTTQALRLLRETKTQLLLAQERLSNAIASALPIETRISIQARITELSHKKEKYLGRLYALRNIPAPFLDLATGSITLAYTIGKAVSTLAPTVLHGLQTATAILGGAAGGLTILLGGYSLYSNVKNCRLARQRLEKAATQLTALETQLRTPQMGISPELWTTCLNIQKTRLQKEEIKAQKLWRGAILKSCASALSTVSGVLGIVSVFTAGFSAIGIAIAAAVLGGIGVAIGLTSYFSTRRLKAELAALPNVTEENCERMASLISTCSEEQKRELARVLEISADLPADPSAIKTILLAILQ